MDYIVITIVVIAIVISVIALIVGIWSATRGRATSNKSDIIIVTDPSDFPSAVAGVRTLENGKIYEIRGIVNMKNDRFKASDSTFTIIGQDSNLSSLTSDTDSSMFTINDSNVIIESLTITCSNKNSQVFEVMQTKPNILNVVRCNFLECNSLGSIIGGLIIKFDGNYISRNSNGIVFDSIHTPTNCFLQSNIFYGSSTGTDVTVLDGNFTLIKIADNHFHPRAGMTALDINIVHTISGGIVESNSFRGEGLFLTSGPTKVNSNSIGWRFISNGGGLQDSQAVGSMYVGDNIDSTDFSVLNNSNLNDTYANSWLPAVAGGAFPWSVTSTARFTYANIANDDPLTTLAAPNPVTSPFPAGAGLINGRLIYSGSAPASFTVTWNGSCIPNGGNNLDYRFVVGRGHNINNRIMLFTDTGVAHNVQVESVGPHELSPGDRIFIRRSGTLLDWKFLGPSIVTQVSLTNDKLFECTYRAPPGSPGFPTSGIVSGGEWTKLVAESEASITMESGENRRIAVSIPLELKTGDYIEPFIICDFTATNNLGLSNSFSTFSAAL